MKMLLRDEPRDRIVVNTSTRSKASGGQIWRSISFLNVASRETPRGRIDLFAAPRLIGSPHGSTLVNLAWCDPGSHMIELFSRASHGATTTIVAIRSARILLLPRGRLEEDGALVQFKGRHARGCPSSAIRDRGDRAIGPHSDEPEEMSDPARLCRLDVPECLQV